MQRRQAAKGSACLPGMACALTAVLREEISPQAQEAIVTALVVCGDEDAATGLAGLLASEDPHLRNLAIEALREIGGFEDLEALRIFAARFTDHFFVAFPVDLVCRRMASGGET